MLTAQGVLGAKFLTQAVGLFALDAAFLALGVRQVTLGAESLSQAAGDLPLDAGVLDLDAGCSALGTVLFAGIVVLTADFSRCKDSPTNKKTTNTGMLPVKTYLLT